MKKWWSWISACVLAAALSLAAEAAEPLRTWRLRDGEAIKATFLRIEGFDSVRSKSYLLFQTEGGKARARPLADFSREDQAYARKAQAELSAKRPKTARGLRAYPPERPHYDPKKTKEKVNEKLTEHFRFVWGNAIDSSAEYWADPKFREMNFKYFEEIWDFYVGQIGVPLEASPWNAKRKINVYISSTGLSKHKKGWAFGAKAIMMHPRAMAEGSSVIPHEFTHAMQLRLGGYRNSPYVGWFWECHANWSCHQFIPDYPPVLQHYSECAHYDLSSTRMNYGSWPFLQYLAENPKFGREFCYTMWLKCKKGKGSASLESPFQTLMRLGVERGVFTGDGVRGFGDVIGRMAARNVTWDYVYQHRYRQVTRATVRNRAVLEKVVDKPLWYQVPYAFAPRQYGYNIIKLIPEKGAKAVTVDFRGLVDRAEGSDWRVTIVAVNDKGEARYSRMWSRGKGSMDLKAGEKECYLTVAATPSMYKPLGFRMGYHFKARYPYEVAFTGCAPSRWYPGYRPAPAAAGGGRHANGGGYVAGGATVAPTAHVGKNAQVLGRAKVTGHARIEGHAIVQDQARVSGHAIVSGFAVVSAGSEVGEYARVRDYARIEGAKVGGRARVIEYATVRNGTSVGDDAIVKGFAGVGKCEISGNAIVGQDSEMNGRAASAGLFYDFVGDPHVRQAKEHHNLYVHWDFGEPNSFLVKDAFAYNDGFARGKPSWRREGKRTCLAFNGKDQYVVVGRDVSDMRDATYDLMVRWSGGAGDQRIFDFGSDAANRMYLTRHGADGKLRFVICIDGKEQALAAPRALRAGVWTRVTIVLNGDTGALHLNGKEVARNKEMTFNPEDVRATANYLARGPEGNYFQGRLDDFRIYTKAFPDPRRIPAPTKPSK